MSYLEPNPKELGEAAPRDASPVCLQMSDAEMSEDDTRYPEEGLLEGHHEVDGDHNLMTSNDIPLPVSTSPDENPDSAAPTIPIDLALWERIFRDLGDLTKGVISKLFNEGHPWDSITDMRIAGDQVMLLTTIDEDSEAKIRLQSSKLRTILGLNPNTNVVPKRYHLQIRDYQRRSDETPRSQTARWSHWNKVYIADAFTSCGTLILCLESEKEALKHWRDGNVTLDFQKAPAKPIDIRALTLWCCNCSRPSHLQRECTQAARCGKCAQAHETSLCRVTGPYRCANCPESHRSASTKCKNADVVKMLAECEKWRKAGPSWAKTAEQPQLPDETLMSQLRSYQNTAAGQAFLSTFMTASTPQDQAVDQGSSKSKDGMTERKEKKRKVEPQDVFNSSNRANFDWMATSQKNQRQIDLEKREAAANPRGPGRPSKKSRGG
ncbi:hypothetical protein FocTR4_00015976 [Fusarium oxysporum f. sp. cubense]|uniref:CCHC-type domain-containing protein n=1 Tax=Fusarium oxysporum f. sp. cubense TaxID=61366 RepID=A0A5C6SBY3_FUSOC|nr:hypothetical protein FocTR4_00015976 [Fusarium oxysporum f. sp. cubense]